MFAAEAINMLLLFKSNWPEIKLMELPILIFLPSKTFALFVFEISRILNKGILLPLIIEFCVPVNLKLPVPAEIEPLFTRSIFCKTIVVFPLLIHWAPELIVS